MSCNSNSSVAYKNTAAYRHVFAWKEEKGLILRVILIMRMYTQAASKHTMYALTVSAAYCSIFAYKCKTAMRAASLLNGIALKRRQVFMHVDPM